MPHTEQFREYDSSHDGGRFRRALSEAIEAVRQDKNVEHFSSAFDINDLTEDDVAMWKRVEEGTVTHEAVREYLRSVRDDFRSEQREIHNTRIASFGGPKAYQRYQDQLTDREKREIAKRRKEPSVSRKEFAGWLANRADAVLREQTLRQSDSRGEVVH